MTINNFNYFAPVSSYNKKRHTNFLIMDRDRKSNELKAIASLRFSFMFPCPTKCLTQKDFSKEDIKYQILLRKELKYCNINREKIEKLAKETYKLGIKEETRKRFNICDLKKLEEKCAEYSMLSKK